MTANSSGFRLDELRREQAFLDDLATSKTCFHSTTRGSGDGVAETRIRPEGGEQVLGNNSTAQLIIAPSTGAVVSSPHSMQGLLSSAICGSAPSEGGSCRVSRSIWTHN